jgi:hypothetical protein
MLRNQFNKTKRFAAAMVASTLVSTGVIVTPITESQQQAVADGSVTADNKGNVSVTIGLTDLKKAAHNFWRNYYAVNFLQIWYASYPPSSVANIKRQYGSSANSVFHAGCKSVYYSWQRAKPLDKAIIDPFGWFFFVHREEKGVVNCYVRMPQR